MICILPKHLCRNIHKKVVRCISIGITVNGKGGDVVRLRG